MGVRMFRTLLLITAAVAAGLCIATRAVGAEPYVLLGLYPNGPLQTNVADIQDVDGWLSPVGKRIAVAGDFMDFEFPDPSWNVPADLNVAWDAGYVPFVNLTAARTSTQIANGEIDAAIATWAGYFATWAGSGRHAFLAPLPEMNGNWTTYYGSPAEFVRAYRHIQDL